MVRMETQRADLYHFLAEALSDPPDWLALPGSQWPLTAAAENLASAAPLARKGLDPGLALVKTIQAAALETRRQQYTACFNTTAGRSVWLNEAGAINGRMLGDETWQVARWYQAAGLEIPGAELPDHASIELEFLAFLAASELAESRQLEQAFLQQHAGRWLPQLGRILEQSGDLVYGPIGQLLQACLALAGGKSAAPPQVSAQHIPLVSQGCTFCMACLAACPREALRVQETQQVTRLVLSPEDCNGCGQCAGVCAPGALQIRAREGQLEAGWQVLFESRREVCPQCGAPFASQAELNYVAEILGHPAWLAFCPDCR